MEIAMQLFARAAQLQREDRLEEAEQLYRQVISLEENHADAWHRLGLIGLETGNYAAAANCIRRCIALRPEAADAHYNLGLVAHAQRDIAHAAECYRKALAIRPIFPEALSNLGLTLQEAGDFDQAIAVYRQALALNPNSSSVLNNLGTALRDIGEFNNAADCFCSALTISPDYVEARSNLGLALYDQGRFEEAEARFRGALELRSDYASAHYNLSRLLLLHGRFEPAWAEYEWRWMTSAVSNRQFGRPYWSGEPLSGKRLLIHAEQGLGDTIQFFRYIKLLKSLEIDVIFECQRSLARLLTGQEGGDQIIGHGDALPEFDFHCGLLSLPGIFKTKVGSIPSEVPYISADVDLVANWRKQLEGLSGFRVGINWHGRWGQYWFQQRDVPVEFFLGLGDVQGIRLVSLQKEEIGEGARSEVGGQRSAVFELGQFDTANGAFMDTAAVMRNLDLVITSDTSVAHLAGALGVQVWVALPFVPDWRWLLDRSDSPWYPTMRLFRQKAAGDWAGVFAEIRAELKRLVAERPATKT